jgi:hypothetical protein
MTTKLMTILDAGRQQLTPDELLTEIEAENRGICEIEAECHRLLGVNQGERKGFPYRCGWLATDVAWCAKRRHYLSSKTEVRNDDLISN